MAVNLTINGTTYSFPNTSDEQWGDNVTNWATAVSSHLLQKTGGSFTLTAEVDFGASYGMRMLYVRSETANPATTGILRLAKSDIIAIRNNANSADITLFSLNGSDQVLVQGNPPLTNPMTTLGDVIYGGASGSVTRLAGDTSNTRKFLRTVSSGGVAAAPAWDTLVAGDIPSGLSAALITSGTFAEARGGTNQSTYTLGDILYASAANTLSKLAGNTTSTRNFLRQTGTGSVSAAPAWDTLVNGDLPSTLSSKTLDDTNTITVKDGSFTLENSSSTTKKAIFDLSGITAANTRTLSVPDSNLTIVGTSVQQTLTNKVYQHAKTATKTANYTAGANDETIPGDSSGGTFTFTLPTAVGITGQRYRFVKVDTSMTKISIGTTSAQTIAGLAATNFTLATPGEFWEFESDGANWQVYDHWYFGGAVAYTPTFTAFGTATSISFFSWREGPSICIQGNWTFGTTTGSQAQVTLGYNGTSANISSHASYPSGGQVVGKGNRVTSSTTFFSGFSVLVINSATNFLMGAETSTTDGVSAAVGTGLGASGNKAEIFAKILVDGWSG